MRGYKVEQDMKKGFMWTRDAALQGNVDAEYNLAVFYYNGMGCEKNIAEAAYWADADKFSMPVEISDKGKDYEVIKI